MTPHEVLWTVDVAMEGLQKVVRLPTDALKHTDAQLQEAKSDIVDYLLECLKVEINGVPVEAETGPLEPVYETHVPSGEKFISHARQQFRYRSAAEVKSVKLSAALFLSVIKNHHAALTVSWNGVQRPFSRFGPFDLELTPARVNPPRTSRNSEAWRPLESGEGPPRAHRRLESLGPTRPMAAL